jgi:hypothetical protein
LGNAAHLSRNVRADYDIIVTRRVDSGASSGGNNLVWIVFGVVLLAGFGFVVRTIAKRLPVAHTVTRTAQYNRSTAEIWLIVSDLSGQPEWRPDLRSAERLPPRGARDVWLETDNRGQTTTIETVESTPHRRLVRRISDENLNYSGDWSLEIGEFGEVTSITITETGEISNSLFRFLNKYIVGHGSGVDRYLTSLGRKLGIDVRITDG